MNARPYQQDCLAAFESGWTEFKRQLGVLPTGAGKTIIFCWMAEREVRGGQRVLVLVDQKDLMRQTAEKLKLATGLNCEMEGDGMRAGRHASVVVAMIQTMSGQLPRWPATHFGLIIADEADKSIADEWQTVLKHFDAKVAGFTATPNRTDKRNLGVFYENKAYEISLIDLINQGYLSRIVVKQLPVKINLNSVHVVQGDFDKTELHDAITPHLTECAKAIKLHAAFRKTLVFVPLIATSLKFVEICRAAGIAAEHIDGTSEDRLEKLRAFERGDFDVLINSQLLTRGVDIPAIDCVFPLRPTKSITLFQQQIGRGTRLHEFKENLLILDPFFEADKRLICRPAHLVAATEEEAAAITEAGAAVPPPGGGGGQLTQFDLLGMASIAQAQRERALRKKLEEHQDKLARTISAEEFALRHNKFSVAEYEPTMAWESQAVSAKQAKYLAEAGIDIASVRGKGHASQLLSIHFGGQPIKMADTKSVELMCRLSHIAHAAGIHDPQHATQAEAGRFFAELRKRKKK